MGSREVSAFSTVPSRSGWKRGLRSFCARGCLLRDEQSPCYLCLSGCFTYGLCVPTRGSRAISAAFVCTLFDAFHSLQTHSRSKHPCLPGGGSSMERGKAGGSSRAGGKLPQAWGGHQAPQPLPLPLQNQVTRTLLPAQWPRMAPQLLEAVGVPLVSEISPCSYYLSPRPTSGESGVPVLGTYLPHPAAQPSHLILTNTHICWLPLQSPAALDYKSPGLQTP